MTAHLPPESGAPPAAARPQDNPGGGDLFDLPPHQRHSKTSRAAAESIKPHLNALQARVLGCIQLEPAYGATDDEIQRMTGMNPSTQRPRRIELLEKGLIRDSGRTRKTKSGRAATVWVVV